MIMNIIFGILIAFKYENCQTVVNQKIEMVMTSKIMCFMFNTSKLLYIDAMKLKKKKTVRQTDRQRGRDWPLHFIEYTSQLLLMNTVYESL